DTVFILSPNDTHYNYLNNAIKMPNIQRIYIEKPLCVSQEEESAIKKLVRNMPLKVTIQAGFQFLQMATVRRAMQIWKAYDFGIPVHFNGRYLHSGYLKRSYREKKQSRLKSAPSGGAIADLGSHLFSLLIAFLGENLKVIDARKSGQFEDVVPESDLCTTVLLQDEKSGAVGHVTASRISAGAGDVLEFEIRCTKLALKISTQCPDILEVFMEDEQGGWKTINCGSDYQPASKFPSLSYHSGWLRSLIHAHYLFFNGGNGYSFVPDINHALEVQRLLRNTISHLITV
ncbi:hypothetical protein MUP95_07805, partial [bacterium]|nr:hypothetical protein [bacterium]